MSLLRREKKYHFYDKKYTHTDLLKAFDELGFDPEQRTTILSTIKKAKYPLLHLWKDLNNRGAEYVFNKLDKKLKGAAIDV